MADTTQDQLAQAIRGQSEDEPRELGQEDARPISESQTEQGMRVAPTELARTIYRLFYSKTVGLSLILLMALLAVLGTLITQVPANVWANVASREAFLEAMRPTFGGWTSVLGFLGLFHVFTSAPFYVVVFLLALSIIACTVHRLPQLWQRVRNPRTHVAVGFFGRARYRQQVSSSVSIEQTLATTRRVLHKNHYRVQTDAKSPENGLYADRNSWSGIGTVIAHLSFVLILAAFTVSSTWGIEEDLFVPVGGSIEVDALPGVSVEAVSFSDEYTEEGRPSDYVTHLIVRDGQAIAAEDDVRVNAPLGYRGASFHQSTFGIAADVTLTDADNNVIYRGAVPLTGRSHGGANAVGQFDLDGTDLEIVVATQASGRADSSIPAGNAVFEVYQKNGQTPIDVVSAAQGTSVEVADMTATFERERQFSGIRMRQDPGAPLMWVGSILLVVGMIITFSCPYRRFWIRVEPRGNNGVRVLIGAVAKHDVAFERALEKIATDLEDQLGSEMNNA